MGFKIAVAKCSSITLSSGSSITLNLRARYTISIDYMTNAEKLWNKARGACELYLERVKPEKIFAVSDKTLEVFVRRLGLRFGPSAATFTLNSPRTREL
jgi:hypothetical protein